MIAIIDYEVGNLFSVERAVRKSGFDCKITMDKDEVLKAEKIIFPGVGAAGKAMENMKRLGLDGAIKEAFFSGTPIESAFIFLDGDGEVRAHQLTQPTRFTAFHIVTNGQDIALGVNFLGRLEGFCRTNIHADQTALTVSLINPQSVHGLRRFRRRIDR